MDSREEHMQRIAKFPIDIQKAQEHASNHRAEILASTICGCFYCKAIFPPRDIDAWVDEDETGIGQTALCPDCFIDSVLGDKSGFPISEEFLSEMHRYWF